MPTPNLPPGFDFTDPDIYAERLPVDELAHMRKVAPIWWQKQERGNLAFGDDGFWVVTKHKDVKEVSRRSDVFSSNKKTALPRYRDEADPESLEGGKVVLLNQDAPHHTHLRKIISRAFTPRAIDRCATSCACAPPISSNGRRPRVPAISSSRCRPSCRCRRSPG